jgi:hypothetical protein
MPRPKQLEIDGMIYWNDGSDLGDCVECGDNAFSYNEDGTLLCEECLIEWHGEDLINDNLDL